MALLQIPKRISLWFSGVVKFDPTTGQQFKSKSPTLPYTRYFAESLIKEAEADDKIVAIHAAMGGGTGLNYFQNTFPERCFDVGIAEQHAVTFAAGLASEGLKPFCAIYSTFLYDLPWIELVWWVQMDLLTVERLISHSWLACQTWWLWPHPMKLSLCIWLQQQQP